MKLLRNIFVACLVLIFKGNAQPDAASKQVINDIIIYQDYAEKERFYYVPYGLKLITDADGKPEFKFIQMRYTGTKAYDDQGTHRFRSLLNFSVSQYTPTKKERDVIIDSLQNKGINISSLQPIPVSNIQTTLVHAADASIADSLKHTISGGFFENNSNPSRSINFKERDFTLRLNNEDAQLFWDSFQGNQPTLSVNYAYTAKLTNIKPDEFIAEGSEEFEERMEGFEIEKDSVVQLEEVVIKSDALPIVIDTEKWPNLIKKIDINEQVPSDYAALDVYCYDFNNEIRDDLYAKRIEIKAVGVGGNDVEFKETFSSKHPDEYAKNIRFIYAVKLSEPYQYRITEIFHNGSFQRHEWETATSWHQILDITSKPPPNDFEEH